MKKSDMIKEIICIVVMAIILPVATALVYLSNAKDLSNLLLLLVLASTFGFYLRDVWEDIKNYHKSKKIK